MAMKAIIIPAKKRWQDLSYRLTVWLYGKRPLQRAAMSNKIDKQKGTANHKSLGSQGSSPFNQSMAKVTPKAKAIALAATSAFLDSGCVVSSGPFLRFKLSGSVHMAKPPGFQKNTFQIIQRQRSVKLAWQIRSNTSILGYGLIVLSSSSLGFRSLQGYGLCLHQNLPSTRPPR